MDTELLRTFLEVSRTRHFGRAARNLFVSQSTISVRIRMLEESIGAPLFVRTHKDIQLSPVGKRLVTHAESILTAWTRAKQEVVCQEEISDLLVMGGVPSLWEMLLDDWLKQVYEQFPKLGIIAEVMSDQNLLSAIQNESLDLAFTFDNPQISNFKSQEIQAVSLVLVSSQPKLSVSEAVSRDYVYVDWGSTFSFQHAKFFPDIPAPRLRVSVGRVAKEFLLRHGGAAYLPVSLVDKDLRARRLYRVKGAPEVTRSIYAISSTNNAKTGIIANVLEYLTRSEVIAHMPDKIQSIV